MRKTHNNELGFVINDWDGNPLDSKGRYANIDGHAVRGFRDVLRWKLIQSNPYAAQKKDQVSNVDIIREDHILDTDTDGVVWLGHATFLFCIGGLRILTDPVLFDIWPLRRFTALPLEPEALRGIDVILLSHSHRDHADEKSMKWVTGLNPDAVIYTGLEIGTLLRKWEISNPIIEAGWYQQYPTLAGDIAITYLPAKHWSRRYLSDLNEALWGSFMITYGDRQLYFGGDSGLGDHFQKIGDLYDIDLAILGIGAYEPIWFMHGSHTSPSDALKAKKSLGADHLIPMHYGTFDLSDEPIFNPKDRLHALSEGRSDVHINAIGERWWFAS